MIFSFRTSTTNFNIFEVFDRPLNAVSVELFAYMNGWFLWYIV